MPETKPEGIKTEPANWRKHLRRFGATVEERLTRDPNSRVAELFAKLNGIKDKEEYRANLERVIDNYDSAKGNLGTYLNKGIQNLQRRLQREAKTATSYNPKEAERLVFQTISDARFQSLILGLKGANDFESVKVNLELLGIKLIPVRAGEKGTTRENLMSVQVGSRLTDKANFALGRGGFSIYYAQDAIHSASLEDIKKEVAHELGHFILSDGTFGAKAKHSHKDRPGQAYTQDTVSYWVASEAVEAYISDNT